MPYPVEASEISEFTPACLRNIPNPPVFKFRTVTHRDKRMFRQTCITEGLVSHSVADIREAILEGFREGYTPESFATGEPRLRAYWEAVDHANKERQDLVFDKAEQDQLEELTRDIVRSTHRVREMVAENATYQDMIGKIAISIFCSGWSGVGLAYERKANMVPLDLIDDLEDKVLALVRANQGVEGVPTDDALIGLPFLELCAEAASAMRVTGDEEKNSSSQSSSDANPAPSEAGKALTTAEKSKASEPSTSEPSA